MISPASFLSLDVDFFNHGCDWMTRLQLLRAKGFTTPFDIRHYQTAICGAKEMK